MEFLNLLQFGPNFNGQAKGAPGKIGADLNFGGFEFLGGFGGLGPK